MQIHASHISRFGTVVGVVGVVSGNLLSPFGMRCSACFIVWNLHRRGIIDLRRHLNQSGTECSTSNPWIGRRRPGSTGPVLEFSWILFGILM